MRAGNWRISGLTIQLGGIGIKSAGETISIAVKDFRDLNDKWINNFKLNLYINIFENQLLVICHRILYNRNESRKSNLYSFLYNTLRLNKPAVSCG